MSSGSSAVPGGDAPVPGGDAPLLSVVIAAYNASAGIRAALDSVLAERSLPLEVVVVDDASTDDTVSIVSSVAAADPRVVLLRQPVNAGVSAARNVALDVVRGEWLCYVDADDAVLPGGLAAMVRAAQEGSALVVIGRRISTDGVRRWYPAHQLNPDLETAGRRSMVRNHGLLANVGPVAKLFHRSLANGLRFEGRMMGDHAWVLRATVRAGDRVLVIDDTVYEWRRPAPGRYFSTITADRERSIPLALSAVEMARRSWTLVSAAWTAVASPAEAHALDVAYLERLVRADLQKAQVMAVMRGDPAIGELLTATATCLRSLPADVVADTHAIADRLVRPTLAFWWRLPAAARPAFADLVQASMPAAPGHPRLGVLRNPGLSLLAGSAAGSAPGSAPGAAAGSEAAASSAAAAPGAAATALGLVLAWPHAVGSLALERAGRLLGSLTRRVLRRPA